MAQKPPDHDGIDIRNQDIEDTTREEILEAFLATIGSELPDPPEQMNGGRRKRLYVMYGSGESRAFVTTSLSNISRELWSCEEVGLQGHKFEPEASPWVDEIQFVLGDSTADQYRNILEQAIPDDYSDRDDIIEAIVEERAFTFSERDNGCERDAYTAMLALAQNPSDLENVWTEWTQPQPTDVIVGNFGRGGTGGGVARGISHSLEHDLLPSAHRDGISITYLTQMGTFTDRNEFQTAGNEPTSDIEQSVENLELAEGLVDKGLITNNLIVQTDRMAITRVAQQDRKGQEWIDKQTGGIDGFNIEDIRQSSMTNRDVRFRRTPARMNDQLRVMLNWFELLFLQPSGLGIWGRDEDIDPSDLRGNYLEGTNLIPSVVQISGVDELQDVNETYPRPNTYVECLRAVARQSARMVYAPLDSESINGAVTALTVGGEQDPDLADLDEIDYHLAQTTGIDPNDITSAVVQGMDENRLPNGPTYISLFTLFDVDAQATEYDHLI